MPHWFRLHARRTGGRLIAVAVLGASLFGTLKFAAAADEGLIRVAVFGTDDRTAPPASLKPYQDALGLLFNMRAKTACTAFCVGKDTIATAAHCIYRTSGAAPPRLADFWFARNYDTVKDYARIAGYDTGAAAQNIIAGSTKLSVSPPIDATSDWALVRLSRPICKAQFGVVAMGADEIARQSQQMKLFQLAYHRDFKQWRAAYSTPCQSARSYEGADRAAIAADFSNAEPLVLHTCDTGGASSGSPLLIETAEGPKVVGINVGTYVRSKILMREGQVAERGKADAVANTGVAASQFAGRAEAFKSARILMAAADIRELQRRLTEAGDYKGPIDGAYGAALKSAIESYEKRSERAATGIASASLLQALRDASAKISR